MENKRSTVRNRDPFAVDPLPKAHYYPSPERRLNKAEKATAIKTNYRTEIKDGKNEDEDIKSCVDEMFLRGTNMYQTRPTGPDDIEDDMNFDETWPSSERPSFVSFTGLDDDCPINLNRYLSQMDRIPGFKQNENQVNNFERRRMPGSTAQGTGVTASRDTGKLSRNKIPVKNTGPGGNKWMPCDMRPGGDQDDTDTDGSVLQRYVDRFRNSKPTSREEREQKTKTAPQDFWWLSNGHPPVLARDREQADTAPHTIPLTTVNLDKYKHLQQLAEKQRSPAYVPESPGDKRTIELQERAERLLERSSSTVLSTEPAVSTEGIGSNTSDMSSLDEYSYRPKFANYLDSDQRVGYPHLSQPPLLGQEPQGGQRVGHQSLVPPPLPGQRAPTENDPLYQWRIRRRMELAQESAPQHTQQFDFINKTEQQKKMDQKLEEFKQKLSGRAPSRSQVQFTPAPQQGSHAQSCQNNQQTEDGGYHEPQIASPSLHRRKPKSEPVEAIDPHLHLMCDLLPCPHRGVFQGTTEPEPSHENRTDCTDTMKPGDSSSCGKHRTSDKRRKYKQYLEAEKPDVENETQKKDSGETGREKGEDTDKRSILEIENMVKDIGKHEQVRSDIDEDTVSEESDRKIPKDSKEGSSDPFSSESEHSLTKSKSLDREIASNGKLKESEETRDRVIKPQHSSSPKSGRKGVNAAIGQVIKENLFSTSTSSVLSSVDSLPPSASTDRLPWKQKPPSPARSHEKQVKMQGDNDIPYESDEEFWDDHLLQMLRKQRASYEQQLQEIDSLLHKTDFR